MWTRAASTWPRSAFAAPVACLLSGGAGACALLGASADGFARRFALLGAASALALASARLWARTPASPTGGVPPTPEPAPPSPAQDRERLIEIQAVAHIGSWELDPDSKAMWASEEALRIYGMDPAVPLRTYEQILHVPHSEDRPRLDAAMRALLRNGAPYDIQFRIVRPVDGETRVVHSWAHVVAGPDGSTMVRGVIQDITERLRQQEAMDNRLKALTRPLGQDTDVRFEDLFDLADIQRIQDEFTAATGVASMMTAPDGTPITKPSRFIRLCRDIIRPNPLGCANCRKSDAVLGALNPGGPIVQPCLSGGLWDAGVSITVGGRHIANWLVGQVRDETQTEESMRAYARQIGADEEDVVAAFWEAPAMSRERFGQVAQALFTLANQLSTTAHQNVLQARFITERKHAEEALRESEARFRRTAAQMTMALEIAHSGCFEWDLDADESVWSDEMKRLHGLGAGDVSSGFRNYGDFVVPEDRPGLEACFAGLISQRAPTMVHYRIRRADTGEVRWMENRAEVICESDGRPARIIGIVTDITERVNTEEELRHQAFHDALTGLPNRILFRERVEHALVRSARRNRRVAVLFIDLDRFKVVNDSLGHQAGDHLLVEAARRIRSCLREEDTAARLGGDEFTVLLEDTPDSAKAVLLAERILRQFGVPFDLSGRETFVSASIGIVVSGRGQDSADDMLRKADVAMYQAKNGGRGRFVVFRHAMSQQAQERLDMETDLRRAIDRGEFRIHYQPIVRLDTSTVCGVEALARWQHPKYGLMPPDAFIPIQEQIGLMGPFTLWALRRAQEQCLLWRRSGHPLTLSVNLSPVNLLEPDFAEKVANVAASTGFDPSWLKLEITENAVMENPARALTCLRRLDAAGVRLSMDDFGTGYSSLAYLAQLPVHEIKIDKSFALSIANPDDDNAAIVRATIDMAHRLRKTVVAEGVETEATCRLLRSIGCDAAQGYHVGRPMPADHLTRWLAGSQWNGAPSPPEAARLAGAIDGAPDRR